MEAPSSASDQRTITFFALERQMLLHEGADPLFMRIETWLSGMPWEEKREKRG